MRLRPILFALAAGIGCASGAASQVPAAAESDEERVWLLQMREEEKVAHDVYEHFAAHGVPFTNVVRSEARHQQLTANLLAARGIADPVAGLSHGRLATEPMQSLYDDLIRRGAASREAALAVAVEVEERDLADLAKALNSVTSADARTGLSSLQRASRNHLRAFSGHLAARGVEYVPKHLSAEEFRTITTGAHEACGEGGCGVPGCGGGAGGAGCGGGGRGGRGAGNAKGPGACAEPGENCRGGRGPGGGQGRGQGGQGRGRHRRQAK